MIDSDATEFNDASSQLDTYHPSFNDKQKQEQQRQKSTSVLGRVLSFRSRRNKKKVSKNGSQNDVANIAANQNANNQNDQLQIPSLSLTSATNNDQTLIFGRRMKLQQQAKWGNQAGNNYLLDYVNQKDLNASGMNQNDDDDDEDEGEEGGWFFGSLGLSPNVSLPASLDHHRAARGQEPPMSSYEDWLDDRQGMNSGEQHELRTKGEQQTITPRPSIDGSIISSLSVGPGGGGLNDAGITSGGPGGSKIKNKFKNQGKPGKLRGKSPSLSRRYKQQSGGKGLLSLASRLRLTKKHDSIAKIQLTMLQSGLISLKKLDRDLQTFLPSCRMNLNELREHVKLIRKYPVLAQIEYKFASRYETYVCRHALQEPNLIKNNYKKCIPYDYNRVVLRTIPGQAHSDYINASYVDSCLKPNAYIAAQGPNEHTLEDFWRMVWEQRSFVLVMLTKVFDFIKVMCNQYWPIEVNKTERHGNIEVTLLYEEPLADFVIRTIRLKYHRGSPQTASANANENIDDNVFLSTQINGESKQNQSQDAAEGDDDEDYCDHENQVVVIEESRADQQNCVRAPKFKTVKAANKPANVTIISETSIIPSSQGESKNENTENEHHRIPSLSPSIDTTKKLSASSSANQLGPLASPLRPDTPSSTSLGGFGVERNSSTRRAVKKRRKPQKLPRNSRPTRTQFQVPNESELVSDESGCEDGTSCNENNHQHQPRERIVYQFHYHNWASHTVPFIGSLLHFRRRVRICADQMAKSGKIGPTVVHCNDGCGRTGAYLCIDANLELADEDGVYDVFNYTKKLRQSRKLLIENLDQYKFVYDVLEEALFCGKTWFNVSELHQKLKHKSHRNATSKKNEYQVEYEKICRMTSRFSIGDCAGGHRVENREKNRDVSTVPPDNFRPYLTSFQTNDSTDYINAVFVDGYTRSKEYIVTEWPLHRTMSDFWSLVYDHDCNSVILLANPYESSTYPSFLPTEKELRRKFGPVFSAEMVSYTHYQNIKSWIYTINKKIVSLTEVIAGVKSETKTTQVFQITCWPQAHRVPTSTNALVELMNMVERWRQRTTYGPVCVVSLDGKSRAGVYCAANVAIEQVVQHGEVDVFQAVKTVRRHRPQLIENMTEYKYCYDLILHYVLHYLNQSSSSA